MADREARRAITQYLHARQILEDLLGAFDVGEERRFAEIAGALVAVAVAGEFVPLFDDRADQRRVALGHPTEGEEGGLGIAALEHLEDALDVSLDAAFAPVPIAAGDVGREGGYLEVVFHVDREGVGEGSCRHCSPPQMF